MTQKEYLIIEEYMLSQMKDAAHDYLHVYRVLYQALKISQNYSINKDVLITSALLHDIGRKAQIDNSALCHAIVGGEMAFSFLKELNYSDEFCLHVKECITTHRFRSSNPPKSMEAKILFDADKLDVTGALGIARSLKYKADTFIPLYTVDEKKNVLLGNEKDAPDSFFREYQFKLSKLYNKFYTKEAMDVANSRKQIAVDYYNHLVNEVSIPDFNVLLNKNLK